jgi:hypothetical protein
VLEEEATIASGDGLPPLAGGGVGDQDGGLSDRRAVGAGNDALDRGAGDALRREPLPAAKGEKDS